MTMDKYQTLQEAELANKNDSFVHEFRVREGQTWAIA